MTAFRRAARVIAFTVVILMLALFGSRPAAQAPPPQPPRVFISEIHPAGSGNGIYNADWFEVTNTGTTDLDITGWGMDDAPPVTTSPVLLTGVATIPAGKSAIFLETATPATTISLFKTAWFGANPPADLLIGTYTGTGVGLGNGGDAVNLFNASGVLVTGVTFGAATATLTFDNTAGFGAASVSAKSIIGTNGAFLSANGVEIGSPGKRINATPLTTLDLSLYERTARFPLPEPTRTTAPPNNLLAQEASAVTYNWDTDSLFVVGDGSKAIVQVTKTGQLIDTMTLALGGSEQGTEFFDTEGLTYVGNGRFVMTEERDRRAVMFKYVPGTTLTRALAQTVTLGTTVGNIGLEGVSNDPQTNGFIFVKETALEGIFQTTIDFAAGTASNGSPATVNSTNLFDPALANLSDFADVYALSNVQPLTGPDSTHLLLLSQEAARIVNIDRAGVVSNALKIVTDPGDTLAAPDMQHEGLTMDWNGTLFVVNENGGGDINHPELWVYKKSTATNLPPTAVALMNQVNSIAENTGTASRIKVADVVIADDGLGTNQISVAPGPDAGAFEIFNEALYIKAGTVLDFETKSVYNVTVVVDDTTVGATPDRTAPFTLNVTNIDNETPGSSSSLIISEVANWGSSVPSYLADWFEVTNTGASPVTLTNWRMDDSSNDFTMSDALLGVASIAPGESVIFMEASPATATATTAAFRTAWFGANPPPGLQIGTYSGGSVGLSTSMVNEGVVIFEPGGNRITAVSFTGGPTNVSLDNRAGLGGTTAPFPTISTASTLGTGGAFRAADNHATGSPGTTAAHVIISEVTPWANDDAPYHADWFEVTNTSPFPVDLTGWRVDDNSNAFSSGVPLRGVPSLLPGKSAVFIEGVADGSTDTAVRNAFSTAWFGSTTPPSGVLIGNYGGSGIGLGNGGDNVNVFDGGQVRVTGISFAGGTSPRSFDNAAGIGGSTLPLPNIALLSALGVRGAFLAADGFEIGSPGGNAVAPTSGNGAAVPPLGALVDGSGASWNLGANQQIFRNGIAVGQGSKIGWFGATLYVLGIDKNWWEWQNAQQRWVIVGPTSPLPAGAIPEASPEGTMVPPAAAIVDALGDTWTLAASGQVLRNGGGSGGGGSKLLWTGGVLYTFGGDANWWAWQPSTSNWIKFGPLAPGLGTPPAASPNGALVPPLSQLVDANGAVWTIAANKQILRNGSPAGTGLGSKLLWSGGVIYTLGLDNNWWRWQTNSLSWSFAGPTQP